MAPFQLGAQADSEDLPVLAWFGASVLTHYGEEWTWAWQIQRAAELWKHSFYNAADFDFGGCIISTPWL